MYITPSKLDELCKRPIDMAYVELTDSQKMRLNISALTTPKLKRSDVMRTLIRNHYDEEKTVRELTNKFMQRMAYV